MTASTSRNLSSTGKTGGRANAGSFHEEPDITALPQFVKRDITKKQAHAARGNERLNTARKARSARDNLGRTD